MNRENPENGIDPIEKYGNEQVQSWRRSFDIQPPKMEEDHPYKNKIGTKILSESLKDTFNRVIPFYTKNIEPLISSKKNVFIKV